MTGKNCNLFTHKSSRSYLNHIVIDKEFLISVKCESFLKRFGIYFLMKVTIHKAFFLYKSNPRYAMLLSEVFNVPEHRF